MGRGGSAARRCAASQTSGLGPSLGSHLPRKAKSAPKREKVRRGRPLSHGWCGDKPARQAPKPGHGPGDPPVGGSNFLLKGGGGSSFKLHEAGSPFPLPPGPKVRLSFPFLGGLFKGPETEGAGPGRLSYAPHTGWTLRETFPSPWPEGVLRGSLGRAGGAGPGAGIWGSRSERAAVRLRTARPPSRRAKAKRGEPRVCACAGAAAELGGGGRDPLPAPPQHRPRPNAPYSA